MLDLSVPKLIEIFRCLCFSEEYPAISGQLKDEHNS